MRFRSFRGRLVIVFVGLFAVIQATCFLVVAVAVRTSARKEINEELRLARPIGIAASAERHHKAKFLARIGMTESEYGRRRRYVRRQKILAGRGLPVVPSLVPK